MEMLSPQLQRLDRVRSSLRQDFTGARQYGQLPWCHRAKEGGHFRVADNWLRRERRQVCAITPNTESGACAVSCRGRICALMDLSCGLSAALPSLKPPGSSVVTSLVSSSSAPEGIGCAVSRLRLAKEIRRESQGSSLKVNRNSSFWSRVSPPSVEFR